MGDRGTTLARRSQEGPFEEATFALSPESWERYWKHKDPEFQEQQEVWCIAWAYLNPEKVGRRSDWNTRQARLCRTLSCSERSGFILEAISVLKCLWLLQSSYPLKCESERLHPVGDLISGPGEIMKRDILICPHFCLYCYLQVRKVKGRGRALSRKSASEQQGTAMEQGVREKGSWHYEMIKPCTYTFSILFHLILVTAYGDGMMSSAPQMAMC